MPKKRNAAASFVMGVVANVLTVRAVGLYSLLGHFGVPVLLAFMWAKSSQPLELWLLALAGIAWLVWTYTAIPKWLRRTLLVFALATIAIGSGLVLHSILYPPPAQAACPNDARSDARFKDAASTMKESFCQPVAPLPPSLDGPLGPLWHHLPYINSRKYLQQLSVYACNLPSHNALVVWGPKSTGKSKGIQEMAELWRKQGRVVIDIDLKDLVGGYDHFVHYFRTKVRQSLSGLDLTPAELQTCYVCSAHLHDKATIPHLKKTPNFLSRWLSDYQLEGAASFVDAANAQWLRDLDTYLQFIFATTDVTLGVDFQGLIEFLELLTVQRPHIGPLVILRELQYLNHIGGEALLSDVLHTLESKKQGRSLVGVIIETSEYTWVEATNLLRSRESFRPYLVSYMDHETTRKELVDILKVFSLEDFELIWDATKGHAGSLDFIFEYVDAGMPLDQAIHTVRTFTYEIMLAALEKAPDYMKCKEENPNPNPNSL
ncbi:hypothetical protein QOT17_008341 [Balamuthia mandrillaris]